MEGLVMFRIKAVVMLLLACCASWGQLVLPSVVHATELSQDDSIGGLRADALGELESPPGLFEDTDADGSVALVGSTGFVGNSFRYRDGEPLVNADPGDMRLFSANRSSNAVAWGIDVSAYQGNIDWAKVKAAGVEFAIIRVGHGWGGTDKAFARNVAGCMSNGIPFGVYYYSCAWDVQSALREADWVLSRLSDAGTTPANLSFPVFYDLENTTRDTGEPAGIDEYNQYHVIVNPTSTLAAMAKTFCGKIAASGYAPGVYANYWWWSSFLTNSVFDGWPRWVAQYAPADGYKGSHVLWQYSNRGSVDGIAGNVDVNYLYDASFIGPDVSKIRFDLSVDRDQMHAAASGFGKQQPANVAFAISDAHGKTNWYQAYRQSDESWTADINYLKDYQFRGGGLSSFRLGNLR